MLRQHYLLRLSTSRNYPNSIPNVTLIVRNAIRLQESTILILKRHSLVMFLLVFDISNYLLQIRLTY